jgi:hypothetical protein
MPGAEPCLVAVADADGCTGDAVVVCAPPADDDAVTVPQPAAAAVAAATRHAASPVDRKFI